MTRTSASKVPVNLRLLVAAGLVVALVVAALCARWLAPFDPNLPDFDAVLAPPGGVHPLGTDQLGRDVLSRILHAAQVTLAVGAVSVSASFAIGTAAGLVAGYVGGWVDAVVMLVNDVLSAFPAVLLALVLAAVLGPGLINVTLAIAVANLAVFARLARAQTLVVCDLGYVEARRGLGFGPWAILLGTVAPNILPPLITQASLVFANSILIEAYLSFLGMGVQPPDPTWGQMLHEAMGFVGHAPWLAWFPGCAITLAVLGFNGLGDVMGEGLDPRGIATDDEGA
jgi:peptide/nickel transport system permease protein